MWQFVLDLVAVMRKTDDEKDLEIICCGSNCALWSGNRRGDRRFHAGKKCCAVQKLIGEKNGTPCTSTMIISGLLDRSFSLDDEGSTSPTAVCERMSNSARSPFVICLSSARHTPTRVAIPLYQCAMI